MNKHVLGRKAFAATLLAWFVAAPAAVAANKAKLTLVPSVAGIMPGRPFDVGVRFEQESGWHIYWQNSGESGLPPTIQWKLPEGFTAGEIQFPIPKRHVSPGDIITNILPGEPILIVSIKPPNSVGASTVKLAAEVRYLICNQNCLQEQADVQVEVPVQTGDLKPANEDLFNRARRALPKTNSKYATLTPSLNSQTIGPGTKFDLLVNVEVAKGHHIQSHTPTLPGLIAADLFMERPDGVRFERPVFPEGKLRPDKTLGQLSEYEGKISIRVPGEISGDRTAGPVKLAGVFTFQACDEQGHCFPPEALSFSTIAGIAASSNPALTAGTTAAAPEAPPPASKGGLEGFLARFGLAGLFVACFLYGLFINATPCVLPLLSIKVLGFVQQSHDSRKRTLGLGLAFGAGVMLFFVLLGLLAASGRNVLQFPVAVILLSAIVLALSLSMLGVYTLQVPAAAVSLDSKIHHEGIYASFGKGALAPVLGFACTGPLLAGAFGWATQQPRPIAVFAFLFMGLGMASPYMLLGAYPSLLSFLPKPGAWMVTFERIMGFVLLGMVVWMMHPLITQIGPEGLEWTLVFFVAVALACWLWGKIDFTMSAATRWRFRLGAVTIVAICGALVYGWVYPLDTAIERTRTARLACLGAPHQPSEIAWQPWSETAVEEAVRSGKVAFVDFTAAYCTVCKVNKRIAIDTAEVKEKLKVLDAVAFVGDFTSGDADIFAVLQKHDRAGVPLNLIYPAGRPGSPIVLDPNLTKEYLLKKLEEAGAVQSASAATAATLGS
jgi:thiol:disulfide interchange protein DsbD